MLPAAAAAAKQESALAAKQTEIELLSRRTAEAVEKLQHVRLSNDQLMLDVKQRQQAEKDR